MAAVVWLVAGFALIVAEVLTGGFVLIMLGVGALAAAAFAALGGSIWGEVAVFAGTSVALTTLARPVLKRRGELWSARAYDETEVLEPGQRVTVMTISGATAVVMGDLS